MAHTWVVIPTIPYCDMCKLTPPAPAYADGKTTLGPWANMCRDCFEVLGIGLGLGMGQELLLEPPGISKEEDGDASGEMPPDVILGLWKGLPIIIEDTINLEHEAQWNTTCPDCGAADEMELCSGAFFATGMRLDAADGFAFSDAKQVSTEDERVRCTACGSDWDLQFLAL